MEGRAGAGGGSGRVRKRGCRPCGRVFRPLFCALREVGGSARDVPLVDAVVGRERADQGIGCGLLHDVRGPAGHP